MSGRSPAGPLIAEHRIIERMIAVLASELESMRSQRRANPVFIDTAVDFIRTYADRCHHGKEEDILFRRLGEKDLDPKLAGVMRELIEEHTHARTVTRQLIDSNRRYADGDEKALGDIESALCELVEFYPVHIAKEDRHFFKPCMAYFTPAERSAMLADFDELDRALIHEKYRLLVEDLEGAAP